MFVASSFSSTCDGHDCDCEDAHANLDMMSSLQEAMVLELEQMKEGLEYVVHDVLGLYIVLSVSILENVRRIQNANVCMCRILDMTENRYGKLAEISTCTGAEELSALSEETMLSPRAGIQSMWSEDGSYSYFEANESANINEVGIKPTKDEMKKQKTAIYENQSNNNKPRHRFAHYSNRMTTHLPPHSYAL